MSRKLQGNPIVKGRGEGPALVTRAPINFTAALVKPANILPHRRDELRDRHHELLGQHLRGTVLVFPACIGSTYTGLVLLELAFRRVAPAAMIERDPDSLLVGGAILGEVWYERGIPIAAYPSDDIFDLVKNGDRVTVDGSTGEITIA
jgi:uncharacterized protein